MKKLISLLLGLFLLTQILIPCYAITYNQIQADDTNAIISIEDLPENIQCLVDTDIKEPSTGIEIGESLYDISVPLDEKFNKSTVYAVPVKYKTENGDIRFINTSFEEMPLTKRIFSKFDYKNVANQFVVQFSKDPQKGFQMNGAFEMSIISNEKQTIEPTIDLDENNDGRLTYYDVYGKDTYVEYININSGIKENIVLEKNIKKNRFDFKWSSDSHIIELSEDKTFINVVSKDTQTVDYVFSPLYVYDSYYKTENCNSIDAQGTIKNTVENATSKLQTIEKDNGYVNKHNTDDCYYEITEIKNGEYIITAVVSAEFLNDENTVYPVTIDPSCIAAISESNIEDTYINEASPNTNYGSIPYMCFGYNGGKRWGYVKFNSLPSQIHCGSQVASAYLTLTFRTGQTTSYTGEIGGITSMDWNEESLTWNNPRYWSGYNATSDHHNCQYYEFNVTDLVSAWYSEDIPNYGMVFTYTNQTYNDYNSVYSSEATSGSAPCLSIIYANVNKTTYAGSSNNNNYNRINASQYIENYALYASTSTYDTPNYYSTANSMNSSGGGDCTNFVSQCLEAGGMSYIDGDEASTTAWYYDELLWKYYASNTWGSATYFCKHWGTTPDGEGNQRAYRTYIYGNCADVLYDWDCLVDAVNVGDVIQFENDISGIYHSSIINYVDKDNKVIRYAQHTGNKKNEDFQNLMVKYLGEGDASSIIIHRISAQ